MKQYTSFKKVTAAKIVKIEAVEPDGVSVISLDSGSEISLPSVWVAKHSNNGEQDLLGGYFVRYADGYESWSPAEAFEGGYQEVDTTVQQFGVSPQAPRAKLSYSLALENLKLGKRVAREGWNGKDMFIFLVDGSTFQVNRAPLNKFYEEGTEVNYHAHVDMRTADGQIVPWLCSQTDMLANDWLVLD